MKNFDSNIFSFFEDDQFIQWVSNPDDASNAYWNEWMQKNPSRSGDLLRAKQIALGLAKAQTPPDANGIAKDIWDKINLAIEQKENVIPIQRASHRRRNLMIAASVAALVLVGSSVYYLNKSGNNNSGSASQKIASNIVSNTLQHTNTTSESRIVYLVDGSKITLQPGASVRHATFLQKDKREVYLDGDAFFEVAKDPNRPFYVYAHDIVHRVLGTSFNVTTDKRNGNVTVLVKTGKVSVYKSNNRNNAEFILTPNESVRYTAQTQSIVKSVSDAELSRINMVSLHPISFSFDEAPVTRIFSILEEAYGIRIRYDEKIFSKCLITTSLSDATFDEKLKIICEAINASYTIQNNEVTIDGKGCK